MSCTKKDGRQGPGATTNGNRPQFIINGTTYYADTVRRDTNNQFFFQQITVTQYESETLNYIAFSNDTVGTYPASSKIGGSGYTYFGAGPYPTIYEKYNVASGSLVITQNINNVINGNFTFVTDSAKGTTAPPITVTGSFANIPCK
jgi:hypothetical protein